MLIFNTLDDILNSDINKNIKTYLSNHIKNILKSYGETSLERVGSLYFLDNNDFERLFPAETEIIWEYTELINIKSSSDTTVSVIHGVVIRNNDLAIDVYVPFNSPDHHLKREMLSNSDEMIDVVV